jgi:hypothetical protein
MRPYFVQNEYVPHTNNSRPPRGPTAPNIGARSTVWERLIYGDVFLNFQSETLKIIIVISQWIIQFYEHRSLSTMFKRARHLALLRTRWIQPKLVSVPSFLASWNCDLDSTALQMLYLQLVIFSFRAYETTNTIVKKFYLHGASTFSETYSR